MMVIKNRVGRRACAHPVPDLPCETGGWLDSPAPATKYRPRDFRLCQLKRSSYTHESK